MGKTLDLSPFRFHFWEKVFYHNPTEKQLQISHKTERFIGIEWEYGDNLYYYLRTMPKDKNQQSAIIIRSIVRNQKELLKLQGKADLSRLNFNAEHYLSHNLPLGESNLLLSRCNASTPSSPSGENDMNSNE